MSKPNSEKIAETAAVICGAALVGFILAIILIGYILL